MKFGMSKGSLISVDGNRINKFEQFGNILDIINNPSLLSQSESSQLESLPLLELPLKSPSKIICLAKNYVDHAKEMGVSTKDIPALSVHPSLFLKPPSALIGPGESIIIPEHSEIVHHEVELAVIIGKKGKNISLENSLQHIFGYSIILDITERTIQSVAKKNGKPWFQAKGYDTFAPIGPMIVSTDEINDPQNLQLELKVNNDIRQKGNTRDMIFNIKEIISYTSTLVTLEPGDIIATGTPSGVGPLNRGDSIIANIESIGQLDIGVI
ncbi:MAG: fumarylacetoacetate hydrolase family protein [Candidatus Hodarchaeales archaeon]|jgi:2-keto-4-pentenoate hydratase/2-oxohepta-3-ene-1,7-dioic acid hydratase in catechol pathway